MKITIPYIAVALLLIGMMGAHAQATSSTTDTTISNIIENSKAPVVTLISQSPDPAIAGDTVKLSFMVENMGGEKLDGLKLEFIPLYPFYALPGETYVKDIPALEAHQIDSSSVVVKFNVGVDKNAIEGTGQVKIRQTMPLGTTNDQLFNVDITGQKFAQIIYIDTSKLQPGAETPLKFTVTNTGNSPLQNLIFSWNEASGAILPVYSDNTKYVKFLDVNESVDLPYTVVANVNSQAGLYQLNLDLKFQTVNGTSSEIQTKAGVTVGGETDFDVAFQESTQGQTSVSIANIGNNPAYSVTVSVPNQPGYRVSGQQSVILGNLDKGDYTLASFQIVSANANSTRRSNFTQASGASGSDLQNANPEAGQFRRTGNFTGLGFGSGGDNLQVRIDYTDTTGARHTVMKGVPIQLTARTAATGTAGTGGQFSSRSQQGSGLFSNPLLIAGIIVVAVAGVFIYGRRKRSQEIIAKRRKE